MAGNADKPYDFEERTFLFAQRVRVWIRQLPRTICNVEDGRQLVRSSGSVAANYIEANESLGPKDFKMKARISRREAKESRLFLKLIDVSQIDKLETERAALVQESTELVKILSAMIAKGK